MDWTLKEPEKLGTQLHDHILNFSTGSTIKAPVWCHCEGWCIRVNRLEWLQESMDLETCCSLGEHGLWILIVYSANNTEFGLIILNLLQLTTKKKTKVLTTYKL